MNTAPRTCVLCGSTSIAKRESVEVSGAHYDLYACTACEGQWWNPFHNPGSVWYERDERYADRNRDPILEPNEKHRGTIRYFGDSTGRVLDVGCGVGNFLAYAEEKGWEGWGIDFDRDAIEAGKNSFGLDHLEVADLTEFSQQHPSLRFDLVTFFDVFEHLDDHGEFITKVRSVLSPGGSIALSMPYRHGWRWLMPHDLPPRHLTRWDEGSLARFLESRGFTVRMVKRLPASFYFLVMKMRFRYGKWASFGLVGKVKEAATASRAEATGIVRRPPGRVRLVQSLAKMKDTVLFGIPAAVLWIGLLFTRARYTDFYVVAEAD